jgi:hypothetical protein
MHRYAVTKYEWLSWNFTLILALNYFASGVMELDFNCVVLVCATKVVHYSRCMQHSRVCKHDGEMKMQLWQILHFIDSHSGLILILSRSLARRWNENKLMVGLMEHFALFKAIFHTIHMMMNYEAHFYYVHSCKIYDRLISLSHIILLQFSVSLNAFSLNRCRSISFHLCGTNVNGLCEREWKIDIDLILTNSSHSYLFSIIIINLFIRKWSICLSHLSDIVWRN